MQRLKAAGRVVRRRRLLFLLIFAVSTIGIIAGVNAVSEDDSFSGQAAPGDHEWWQLAPVNPQNPNAPRVTAAFCANCHQAVQADLVAGPHLMEALSDCLFCHRPGTGDHAAAVAECVDCHSGQATALANDAHAGILVDLNETTANASQTCQTCHTHVSINIAATVQPPLELNIGN